MRFILFLLVLGMSLDAAEVTVAVVSKPYDKNDAKKVVSLKESQAKDHWRMVHDGKRVLALWEGIGLTWTKNEMFCADTKAECDAQVKKLGLEPLQEDTTQP